MLGTKKQYKKVNQVDQATTGMQGVTQEIVLTNIQDSAVVTIRSKMLSSPKNLNESFEDKQSSDSHKEIDLKEVT